MFNKYFGHYLLSKHIITKEQLIIVLSDKNKSRVKLGVLAIDAGYMTAAQVTEVHNLQAKKDRRFGDLAIENGFLTEEQLEVLLSKQQESHTTLGQVLMDEQIMSYDDYEQLLVQYKIDSGFSDDEIEILKSNDTDAILELFLDMGNTEEVKLFKAYVELFIRNIIRFVDRDVVIGKPYLTEVYAYQNYASQDIVGSYSMETGLSASDDVIIKFAMAYTNMSITEVNAMAKDAIGEFMNCQNGLFISNLYHKGINCNIEPQVFREKGEITAQMKLFVLPCDLPFGNVDILFSI
ncbi:chemotaxis protein CheX [Fusibacter sp. 3D3]|uniref:chemotaxis protein CheX n=1 Tax=Fusibacter sp. 3D3 TaxID=1048380 RepID=UPI00085390EE|nr:chemotaxis protein CheX [Fusibacter sp. 3D3]GAU77392.1 hypothetical protein F3D3_2019 [Fusibacter sp. 3D3]